MSKFYIFGGIQFDGDVPSMQLLRDENFHRPYIRQDIKDNMSAYDSFFIEALHHAHAYEIDLENGNTCLVEAGHTDQLIPLKKFQMDASLLMEIRREVGYQPVSNVLLSCEN